MPNMQKHIERRSKPIFPEPQKKKKVKYNRWKQMNCSSVNGWLDWFTKQIRKEKKKEKN